MSKVEKKKSKLRDRIAEIEAELILSLSKKISNTKEIDVISYQRKIENLKIQLNGL